MRGSRLELGVAYGELSLLVCRPLVSLVFDCMGLVCARRSLPIQPRRLPEFFFPDHCSHCSPGGSVGHHGASRPFGNSFGPCLTWICGQADGRWRHYSPHFQQIGAHRHRLVLLTLCRRPWARGLNMMTIFARRRQSSTRVYFPQKSWDQQGNRYTAREFMRSAAPASVVICTPGR